MSDPFGTAALRAAVLDSWASSPTRFREDANAEEDLRLGGYADAWCVELAQNAADAARAAGVPGRLRVRVEAGELRVANTGAPLDAPGVAALASLRASAKRDDAGAVGRFGVGFAAVLPLSDAPRVVGRGGGVAFSAARTADAVAALPGPAAELARRGEPPVLRLVWPTDEEPPPGYDTEVRLPLRPGTGDVLARARAAAPDLLLALPDLVEVDVAGEVVRRADVPGGVAVGGRRWRLARRSGELAAAEAGAQPVEQRARRTWAAAWALPLDGPLGEDVLHAPTPTAEVLALPARLLATVPLEPDRRRVRPGAATDAVLAGAVAAYVDLVRATPPADRLALVPEPGFPRSPLDGRLRDALLDALRTSPWLPPAIPAPDTPAGESDVRPGESHVVNGESDVAAHESGISTRESSVAVPDSGARRRESGVPATGSAGAADTVLADPTTGPPHQDVRPADPAVGFAGQDVELGRPDVGLADEDVELAGRGVGPADADVGLAGGGAGLVPARAEWLDVPGDALPGLLAAAGFDRLAAAPVPASLGAHRIGAAELVERLFGVERPPAWWRELYAGLDAAADTVPGLREDLRALPVPLADGRTAAGPATVLLPPDPPDPAVAALAALALPGLHVAAADAVHPVLRRLGASDAGPAALLEHPALADAVDRSLDDAGAGLDPRPLAAAVLGLVQRAGRAPAALAALALPAADGRSARADELVLPDAALRPLLADDAPVDVLDADLAARVPRAALVAVGVLDGPAVLVEDDPTGPHPDLDDAERWWDGLDEPPRRLVAVRDLDLVADDAWPAALALLAADRDARAAVAEPGGYTAWWLARHARLAGHRPGHWRLPSARHLAGLFDPAPDVPLAREAGVRADLVVADARDADDLLDRLADPGRHPSPALVAQAHAALADAVAAGRVDAVDLHLPERVRAMDGSVVGVDVAVVLDAPWPAAVLPAGELVIGGDPVALAELLDLPLAGEVVAGDVEGAGEAVAWADLGEVVVACHTLGVDVPPGGLHRHDELRVALRRPLTGHHRVPVWRDADGGWHAEDPLRALLAVLAEG